MAKKQVAVYLTAPEHKQVRLRAGKWQVSVSEAVARLVRTALSKPVISGMDLDEDHILAVQDAIWEGGE